jgi:hypothetical protein
VKHDPEATQNRPEQNVFKLLTPACSLTRAAAKRLLFPLIAQVLLRATLLPAGTWAMAAVINGPIEHRDSSGIIYGALGFAALGSLHQLDVSLPL